MLNSNTESYFSKSPLIKKYEKNPYNIYFQEEKRGKGFISPDKYGSRTSMSPNTKTNNVGGDSLISSKIGSSFSVMKNNRNVKKKCLLTSNNDESFEDFYRGFSKNETLSFEQKIAGIKQHQNFGKYNFRYK